MSTPLSAYKYLYWELHEIWKYRNPRHGKYGTQIVPWRETEHTQIIETEIEKENIKMNEQIYFSLGRGDGGQNKTLDKMNQTLGK